MGASGKRDSHVENVQGVVWERPVRGLWWSAVQVGQSVRLGPFKWRLGDVVRFGISSVVIPTELASGLSRRQEGKR